MIDRDKAMQRAIKSKCRAEEELRRIDLLIRHWRRRKNEQWAKRKRALKRINELATGGLKL